MLLNNILDILHKYRRKNWIFLRMPPVRGRELKLDAVPSCCQGKPDAPCAGARIETIGALDPHAAHGDAPCAGARIETCRAAVLFLWFWMPPVRGRELKHHTRRLPGVSFSMPPVRGRELKLR